MSARHSFLLATLTALPSLLPAAARQQHGPNAAHHRRHAGQKAVKTMFAMGEKVEVDLNIPSLGLPAITGLNDSLTETAQGLYGVMKQVTAYSWEWGTQTEVAVELFYPELGVFSSSCPYPLSCADWSNKTAPVVPTEVFDVIDPIIAEHAPVSNQTAQPIVDGDGAAGDPASLGVAALLAGATNTTNASAQYTSAAALQLEYLLEDIPRDWDDGISQRESEVQFWSDNGYMSPPFLAYYGALEGNLTLLSLAHQQYAAYRNVLMDNSTHLWRHIMLGSWNDTGFWSTGAGWTAAGMMRTLASLAHVPSSLKASTLPLRQDLHDWTAEMLSAVWAAQDAATGLLPNYYDAPANATDAYYECAGTALLSAASFRLAQLTGDASFVPQASYAMFSMLNNNVNASYVLGPVVNPLAGWNDPGPLSSDGVSAEAQGFAVAMIAAWRDMEKGGWGWALE